MRSHCTWAAGLALVLSFAGPVRSEEDAQQAKASYEQAEREYRLGHYDTALGLFESAYKIKSVPALLYNVAQCHRMLGHLEEARRVYRSFISQAPESPYVEPAKGLLAEVEQALKAQAEAKRNPPTGLAPTDKGAPRPTAQELRVAPPSKAMGWIAVSAGVGALAFGGVAIWQGVSSSSSYDSANKLLVNGQIPPDRTQYDRFVADGDSAKRNMAIAGVLAGVSAVTAGLLGYLSYRQTGEVGPFRF